MNRRLNTELTVGQQALWLIQHLDPACTAYNTAIALRLRFRVEPALLESAVRAAVLEHSLLGSTFPRGLLSGLGPPGGQNAPGRLLEIADTRAQEADLRSRAAAIVERPFRLECERPIRVALIRADDEQHVLLVVVHHIAADNISQLNICRRILSGYAALLQGRTPSAEDDGTQFEEFAQRQRQYLASDRAALSRAFWLRELADLSQQTELPTDLPVPETYRHEGAQIELDLPSDLVHRLDRAANRRNTTRFALLMTAFQVLLHTHAPHADAVIGYPVTMRRRDEREAIGYFVNMLPLRVRIGPRDAFDDVLYAVTRSHFRALMHREYPFALLPWPATYRPDSSRPGPVSALFVLNDHDPTTALGLDHAEVAGLGVARYPLPDQLGQFWLTLQVTTSGARAEAVLKYNTSLFSAQRARLLAEQYTALLSEQAAD